MQGGFQRGRGRLGRLAVAGIGATLAAADDTVPGKGDGDDDRFGLCAAGDTKRGQKRPAFDVDLVAVEEHGPGSH
jgi:hypothetical protein